VILFHRRFLPAILAGEQTSLLRTVNHDRSCGESSGSTGGIMLGFGTEYIWATEYL